MTNHSHWPGGPPRPSPSWRFSKTASPQESIPSWGRDLKRLTYAALFSSSLCTLLMLMSGNGLLRGRSGQNVIEPDGLWAGLLVVMAATFWVSLLGKRHRVDRGFRRQGLASLLLIGVLVAVIIQLTLMLLRLLVIDKAISGQTVIALYGSDPTSSAQVATFTISLFVWCAVCVLLFARGTVSRTLLSFGLLAVVAGIGAWQAINILENSPSATHLLVWSLIAVLGVVVLPLMAAVVTRTRRDTAQTNRKQPSPNMTVWNR